MNTSQPATALAAAFSAAGFTDPLTALLREAWRVSPRNSEGRLAHVQRGMRDNPALLWTLLEQQNALAMVRRCVESALTDARESATAVQRDQSPPSMTDAGGDQLQCDTLGRHVPFGRKLPGNGREEGSHMEPYTRYHRAPSSSSSTPIPSAATSEGSDGRDQDTADTHLDVIPAVTSQFPAVRPQTITVQSHLRSVPRKSLKQMADEQAEAMASKRATEVKYGILDTFLVNDVPIGRCTAAEVRKWADSRDTARKIATRDVMFARSMAANLPGNRIIREVWGVSDAEAAYARAGMAAETSDVA